MTGMGCGLVGADVLWGLWGAAPTGWQVGRGCVLMGGEASALSMGRELLPVVLGDVFGCVGDGGVVRGARDRQRAPGAGVGRGSHGGGLGALLGIAGSRVGWAPASRGRVLVGADVLGGVRADWGRVDARDRCRC